MIHRFASIAVVCIALTALPHSQANDAAGRQFDTQIAPLLAKRCLDCHNPSDKKGGLDLTQRQAALKGGDSGPAVAPGKPDASLLVERIVAGDMPPKTPLAAAEREQLKQWIAAGAPWGADPIDRFQFTSDSRAGYDWWALQPLTGRELPEVTDKHWPRSPLDYFVLARLEAQGLQPAPPAERRVWLRRVTHDLLGLPPTPDELARFLADDSPQAFERVVDRLLESPHYGERWARHWLDIVRFAESDGFERDQLRENAFRYRDWVIQAFNDDLPYDEFVRLQIAGDVLLPDDPGAVIATGYLVCGPRDRVGETQQSLAMRAVVEQDALEDIVGATAQTFLGLTVHCARCHDHKFDPVSQVEYYQLASVLRGVKHGDRDSQSSAAGKKHARQLELLKLERTHLEQKLAALSADEQEQRAELELALSQGKVRQDLLSAGKTYAVVPQQPAVSHVLARGNPSQPGAVAIPGALAACGGVTRFGLEADAPEAKRRVALAYWLTDPANPLPARVIVNRIWHYHFGLGIVDTPNDLGFNGSRPSHPQLLDRLARELIAGQWSLKQLHRTIVLSATYRQSSRMLAQGSKLDADNRLLWRKTPLRLEAEDLRDSMLAVAGTLNPQMGGPGYLEFKIRISNSTFYDPIETVGREFQRRSIYRTWLRSGTNRFLDVFDCPDPSTVTPKRAVTTTPLQALALLNNAFVLRVAQDFAARLERSSDQLDRRIETAHALAFSRPARNDELALGREFVKAHGSPAYCRVLFNSNEFLYVD